MRGLGLCVPLSVPGEAPDVIMPALLPALEAAAPHLEALDLIEILSDITDALAAPANPMRGATRLTSLGLRERLNNGPPGMLAAAFPAIAAASKSVWSDVGVRVSGDEDSRLARLHRDIMAASAAAGRPVRLRRLGKVALSPPPSPRGWAHDVEAEAMAVAAIGGASLVALTLGVDQYTGVLTVDVG